MDRECWETEEGEVEYGAAKDGRDLSGSEII